MTRASLRSFKRAFGCFSFGLRSRPTVTATATATARPISFSTHLSDRHRRYPHTATSDNPSSSTSTMASGCPDNEMPEQQKPDSDTKTNSTPVDAQPEPEQKLPPLSAADFEVYNRLATMMNAYHNHFRHTWNMLYKACTTGTRANGMSLRSFIGQGQQFCRGLTMHHTIEEQHFFPVLGERMPAFCPRDHLISQHEEIHEGLVKLEEYLDACRGGEKELRLQELKEIMDSFGAVLWAHLDDEVRMLGAENMRKYWSKADMRAMPW